MGTTLSFFWILNTGREAADLRRRLRAAASATPRPAELLEALRGDAPVSDAAVILAHLLADTPQLLDNGPFLAYRKEAPWLPYFDGVLCDGRVATSWDAMRVSRRFGAPVLVMALYESRILFLSRSDAAHGSAWDFAKANSPAEEHIDRNVYSTDFPEFLLDLCPPDGRRFLRRLWEGPENRAEDRLEKLCSVLFLPLLSAARTPVGFQLFRADD